MRARYLVIGVLVVLFASGIFVATAVSNQGSKSAGFDVVYGVSSNDIKGKYGAVYIDSIRMDKGEKIEIYESERTPDILIDCYKGVWLFHDDKLVKCLFSTSPILPPDEYRSQVARFERAMSELYTEAGKQEDRLVWRNDSNNFVSFENWEGWFRVVFESSDWQEL